MGKQTGYPFLLRLYLTDPCSLGSPLLSHTCSQSFWQLSQLFSTCRYPRARAKLGRRSYICHLESPPQGFHRGPQVGGKPWGKSYGSAGPRLSMQSPEVLSCSCLPPSSRIGHLFGNLQIYMCQKPPFPLILAQWSQFKLGASSQTGSQKNIFPLLFAGWIPGERERPLV